MSSKKKPITSHHPRRKQGDAGAQRLKQQAPRTRGDKRQRTRARIIEAAGVVIGQNGIDATSLESIAEKAGMSRGAIYNNFRNKEEIFLAVAMTRWGPVTGAPANDELSFEARMRHYGEAVADAAMARRKEAVGATSFVQFALRNEGLRQQIEQANAAQYMMAAERLKAGVLREHASIFADMAVKAVHAMTEGMIILHALTPELITRDVIVNSFEALARGWSKGVQPPNHESNIT